VLDEKSGAGPRGEEKCLGGWGVDGMEWRVGETLKDHHTEIQKREGKETRKPGRETNEIRRRRAQTNWCDHKTQPHGTARTRGAAKGQEKEGAEIAKLIEERPCSQTKKPVSRRGTTDAERPVGAVKTLPRIRTALNQEGKKRRERGTNVVPEKPIRRSLLGKGLAKAPVGITRKN